MAFDINQLGMQAAGKVLDIGVGALTQGMQIRGQKKLMEAQQRNQEELMDKSQRQQLDMWHATNYGAQVNELNKAGLNPGLLYGMGGTGGATTGTSSGSASGGQAQGIQANPFDIAQMQLISAQVEKLKAETEDIRAGKGLKEAQTGAIPYQIDELIAKANNHQANTDWTNAKKEYQKLENQLATDTMQLKIDGMATALEIANSNAKKAFQEAKIAEGTANTLIKQANANLIKTGVESMLASEHINLSVQQRTQIVHAIEQKWTELWHRGRESSIEHQRVNIQETLNQFNIDNSIKNDIMNLLYGTAGNSR